MLFNSFNFLIFFPVVCLIYWALPKNVLRNLFLLIASYYFYANWNPSFALVLLGVTLVTYWGGQVLETDEKKNVNGCSKRKKLVWLFALLGFLPLLVFKYYNFLNDSISAGFASVGLHFSLPGLNWAIPVGISFFTFQAIGYMLDVYHGRFKAEKNILDYLLFVSFFPVILAGPIQRAKNLIPQLKEKHILLSDDVTFGLRMMVWGFFMKLCVADRLGTYVDSVFNNLTMHNGTSISIASVFYTIQIYGDFAGYSLVALGCARILGFRLPENFRRPYFSATFKEFWKRWHIALSSWFGDYLYIPLGGNRVKYWRYLLNLMIVFLVSGLWHGAAWTFVIWGGIHGLYLIGEALWWKRFGKKEYTKWYIKLPKILFVFVLVNLAWVFFRASTIDSAFMAISKMFTNFGSPFIYPMAMIFGILSTFILFVKDYADEFHPKWKLLNSSNDFVSVITTAVLIVFIFLFGVLDSSQFIYFQF